jgi:predicted metal-binding protein
MDRDRVEAQLSELPLAQYAWVNTEDLTFSQRIRYVCQTECPMYGKSWACPPAVGTVEECRARCQRFSQALVITTVTEVRDIADIQETLSTRAPHEELTRQVRQILLEQAEEVMVLSTEACAFCECCTYPEGKPCRNPERMFPCVESYGIVATDLAEKYEIEFYNGNLVTWFSILFYR